ncbi:MAG: hypothetical protein V3V08_05610 [Nannocystaceae bacterium]
MKRCITCGGMRPNKSFHKQASHADGLRSQCKSCRKVAERVIYERRKEKAALSHAKYVKTAKGRAAARRAQRGWAERNAESVAVNRRKERRRNPWKPLLYGAKHRAKRIGVPFNLTAEDVVVPEFCPALGIPLFVGDGKVGQNSPTIDRLVPDLGYVKDNVVIVSFRANAIKNDATLSELQRVVSFYSRFLPDDAVIAHGE